MSLMSLRLRPQNKPENPCAKKRISLAVSTRFYPSRSSAKNIPLCVFSERCLPLIHPASCRGAYASSRYVECGLRWTRRWRKTSGACADGEVVWSWRSDAGAKFVKTLTRLAGDGGNQAWSPGRARRKPLKPFAQGGPGYPAGPVVLLHAGHGYQQIPGLPCALSIGRGTCLPHHSGAMRRENAGRCLLGCLKFGCLKSRIGTTIPRSNLALCRRHTGRVISS